MKEKEEFQLFYFTHMIEDLYNRIGVVKRERRKTDWIHFISC